LLNAGHQARLILQTRLKKRALLSAAFLIPVHCQLPDLAEDLPCLESTYSLTLKLLLRAAQSANLARRVLQEMAHQRPCVIQPIVQL
jgi:hypothetical protein